MPGNMIAGAIVGAVVVLILGVVLLLTAIALIYRRRLYTVIVFYA